MPHTPGPWHVAKGLVGREIRADNGPFIADVYACGLSYGERNANARLIAAAPSLLKIAKAAYHALESYSHGNAAPDLAKAVAAALAIQLADIEDPHV